MNVAQINLAVAAILSGQEFSLDEEKAPKGAITLRTIGRYERAIAVRKGLASYFRMIGDDPPSASERAELETARDQITAVLSR